MARKVQNEDIIIRINSLISRDRKGQLTEEENLELQAWLNAAPVNRDWYDYMLSDDHTVMDFLTYQRARRHKVSARVRFEQWLDEQRQDGAKVVRLWFLRRPLLDIAVASVLILSAGIGSWLYIHGKSKGQVVIGTANISKLDLPPGGNKAVLTLANGSTIVLDSAGNGTLAYQGNMQVVKLDSGVIAYNGNQGVTATEALYNIISTPRGGQFKIVLPDGSKVWLNSASQLRFPTEFNGSAREVELKGEGYFEITQNKEKPFRVLAADCKVNVLGTHFNIQAYTEEPALVMTLLQGAVNVSAVGTSKNLRPGQEARISDNADFHVSENIDTSEVVAWKDGRFIFDHTDLKAGMREIARWYDVDIEYQGTVSPNRKMLGSASRNEKLSVLLRLLNLTGIHCQMDGRKIIVNL